MGKTKELGDDGERFVLQLLIKRGYQASLFGVNFRTYDLQVSGPGARFMVSVKTNRTKQHVRLGRDASRDRLAAGNFVIALMPLVEPPIALEEGRCRLMVIPAERAREDGKYVHEAYLARNPGNSDSMGTIVKGDRKTPEQVEVWQRWLRDYCDAWHLLPPAR